MPPELREALNEQRERFKQKFGRYPGPQDPILWDENADDLSPAKALQSARNQMRSSKRWQSPYFWAAFVIQGEYR